MYKIEHLHITAKTIFQLMKIFLKFDIQNFSHRFNLPTLIPVHYGGQYIVFAMISYMLFQDNGYRKLCCVMVRFYSAESRGFLF